MSWTRCIKRSINQLSDHFKANVPPSFLLERVAGVICAAALLLLLLWPHDAQAQSSVPDVPCRGCHGDNQRSFTLPSGESLPLLVDLPTLDASAHHFSSPSPVSCSDCHTGRARYRYPHQSNPAQNVQAFSAAAEQSCQSCHTPHNPFHDPAKSQAKPGEAQPTCVDCHGSHQVDRVEKILNQMPSNCVACHTEQSTAWAADLIAPRPGLGQGAEGYAGSARCVGCHADIYQTWRQTMHAKSVQLPSSDATAVVGDFTQNDPDLSFGLDQVAYTLGGRLSQQYLTRTVDGKIFVLPAQWSVAKHEWLAFPAGQNMGDGQNKDEEWRQSCSGCHVTGLLTTTWEFTEFGVGCESCHGPSEAHIADPKKVKPFTTIEGRADDQVCGSCHSRGKSPDGLPFPASYHPGDKLSDHFSFSKDVQHVWPDGSAKQNNQQYMDWQLGSRMAKDESMRCVSCHAVHGDKANGDKNITPPALLKSPVDSLCVDCHHDQQELLQHTPYHQQASSKQQFTCLDCHMPKMATLVEAYDTRSHSFLQPNPQASIDHGGDQGGITQMPNACNLCHTQPDEDAKWAAQTIAYAKTLGVVGKKSLFAPGPTPTSPPPPTPLPSVGEPAEPYYVDTAGWLRSAFFGLVGLILLVVVVVALRAWLFRGRVVAP